MASNEKYGSKSASWSASDVDTRAAADKASAEKAAADKAASAKRVAAGAKPETYQEHIDAGWRMTSIRTGETRSVEVTYDPLLWRLELSEERYGAGGEELPEGAAATEVEVEESATGGTLVIEAPLAHDLVVPTMLVGEVKQEEKKTTKKGAA